MDWQLSAASGRGRGLFKR